MATYAVLPSLFSKPDYHKRRFVRTVSMLCEEEPLSDIQLKAYQTRLQEYKNFLEVVSRLASTGNVCVTEESVSIGENGLLTGEALNALQHAGSISVYNTLQQNNWKFPVPEEGEVVVLKRYTPVADEFLDSENPIRSDWPAICLTDCFIEGERARLNGNVRPVRTYLPPNIIYRNVADVDDDSPETDNNMQVSASEDGFKIVVTESGLMVKRPIRDGKDVEMIPLDEYYFGRQDGSVDYRDERGEYRYKCAVCDKMLYSNVKLMYHILGHVDEKSQSCLNFADLNQCRHCFRIFPVPSDLRNHVEQVHQTSTSAVILPDNSLNNATNKQVKQPQTASQLLMQQQQAANLQQSQPVTHPQPTSHMIGRFCPNECRICGKEVNSEYALANHLQSIHRQREMPYVCRLCGFRSSLYEDILDHFKKIHGGSNHLLCIYCLRVFTISDALLPSSSSGVSGIIGTSSGLGQTSVFYQHLKMHLTPNQCRKCPACKLSFTNKSDYQLHRKLDHKGSSIPYSVHSHQVMKQEGVEMELGEEASDGWLNENVSVKRMNAPGAARVTDLSHVTLPEDIGELLCIECGTMIASNEHKQYLPCSLCRFATCCANAFTRHSRQLHGLGSFAVESTMYPGRRRTIHDDAENENEGVSNAGPLRAEDFYCCECLGSGWEGNALAQHLVEECGVDCVTLKPDPTLLAAKEENNRIKMANQQEKAQEFYSIGDEPMRETAEPMDVVAPGNTVMVQFGGEGEEEMQQFVLPEGLTLEEGQTLVMIQGEDGQPQLAIVNQEDLITSEDQELDTGVIEVDEESQGIVYQTMEGQPSMPQAEDEKENQFS